MNNSDALRRAQAYAAEELERLRKEKEQQENKVIPQNRQDGYYWVRQADCWAYVKARRSA